MAFAPVWIDWQGKRVLVVGGGAVARRKAASFAAWGADVMVVAPHFSAAFSDWKGGRIERAFAPGDLEGAALAVFATDDPRVQNEGERIARERGILVNRADDASCGDVHMAKRVFAGGVEAALYTGEGPFLFRAIASDVERALAPWSRERIDLLLAHRRRVLDQVGRDDEASAMLDALLTISPEALAFGLSLSMSDWILWMRARVREGEKDR